MTKQPEGTALPVVRPLRAADATFYRAVRLAALQNDPLAFITTAAEFAERSLESVAAQIDPKAHAVTFGAFLDSELVGILTLTREERPSLWHRANIYGVAVLPQARGQGCAGALINAALTQARTWNGVTSVHLAVIETQYTARRLYERHGFQLWGTQPDALRNAGKSYSEHWLWRDLTD